ncbi:nickel-binding protein [Sunxiuqinia sp. sy24]|uniref:nickel-binding protein n=1 Tax=Sunxiuqinia sp. sy24 TaxID=3461495 RepID=UPI004045FFDB
MPIFMDRHDVSDQVTAEAVARLHQQDLEIQTQFACRALTYWFDEHRKMAFCLIEAPSEQHIIDMHNEAHGDIPNQIIEVDTDVVESFLGRIKDPEQLPDFELNIIADPAFRAIMVTGFDETFMDDSRWSHEEKGPASCLHSLEDIFSRFDGSIARQKRNRFVVSFESVSQAVWCAIEVQSQFEAWSDTAHCAKARLKTGISVGVPVTEDKSFFEEAIQAAERMFYISNTKIVVAHEVKKLYRSENLNVPVDVDLFVVLSSMDEKFLDQLMNYIEETWQNQDLHVDDLGKHLGYSRSQLYRRMVSLTGMSPNNFIREYRLNKALSLINQQSGNISEIAYETGFNSPSYFAKCFHKKYGLSPSDYQHQLVG